MSHQVVKFKLINHDSGAISGSGSDPFLPTDPKGYENSQKTLKRSTSNFGVWTELSKDLFFTKEGADFLIDAYTAKYIQANVTLEEWRQLPHEDGFYLYSSGTFDFSEIDIQKLGVKIPFKTGGLHTIIESQLTQDFELQRLTSLKGEVLPPLELKDIQLTSRAIFLLSQWTIEEGSFLGIDPPGEGYFGYAGQWRTPMLNILSNSDAANVAPVLQEFIPWTLSGSFVPEDLAPEPIHFFYFQVDLAKTVRVLNTATLEVFGRNGQSVSLYIMHTALDYSVTEFREIFSYPYSAGDSIRQYPINVDEEFDLIEGDSLMWVYNIVANASAGGQVQWARFSDYEMSLTEDSVVDDTTTKGLLIHEAGERLMEILTGETGRYYSEFYGRTDIGYDADGEFSYTGLTYGFWIRQFFEKQITLNCKELFETTNALHATGWTIDTIDGVEVLVHEDLKYFFQQRTLIKIPGQVSKYMKKPAKEFVYPNAEWGYDKGGEDYDEAHGLDEYNGKINHTHPFDRVQKGLKVTSPSRGDKYGAEFARRRPKETYPREDTSYDSDKWVLDLKEGLGTFLQERTWEDDYEEAPVNVYSPETATNLRITPFRNSERHEWWYSGSMKAFQDEVIRFSSNIGNSSLGTKKVGEVIRYEDGNKNINELEKPRVQFEWITFSYPLNYELLNQVYGRTNIDGRSVPNYFGLVEYYNDKNQKEYGYLFQLEPSKEGKWKLLKAS